MLGTQTGKSTRVEPREAESSAKSQACQSEAEQSSKTIDRPRQRMTRQNVDTKHEAVTGATGRVQSPRQLCRHEEGEVQQELKALTVGRGSATRPG
jgi:hypothetical protein